MKYIVVLIGGKEMICVFPANVAHDTMAEGIFLIRPDAQLISAGFVIANRCGGESLTLRLPSRGEVDTALLCAAFGIVQ